MSRTCHYGDVIRAPQVYRLSVQTIGQSNINENIKTPHCWLLRRKSIIDRPSQNASNTETFPYNDVSCIGISTLQRCVFTLANGKMYSNMSLNLSFCCRRLPTTIVIEDDFRQFPERKIFGTDLQFFWKRFVTYGIIHLIRYLYFYRDAKGSMYCMFRDNAQQDARTRYSAVTYPASPTTLLQKIKRSSCIRMLCLINMQVEWTTLMSIWSTIWIYKLIYRNCVD